MKNQRFNSLLAAAIGVCLAVPAFASVPSTSAEFKGSQADQVAKKGKAKKPKASKAPKQA